MRNLCCFLFIILLSSCATVRPKHVVQDLYLTGLPSGKEVIPYSSSLAELIKKNHAVCKKHAGTDICGWNWGLTDSQEGTPVVENLLKTLKFYELPESKVRVTFNVFPEQKDAGQFYERDITYQMVYERGRWVVDEIYFRKTSARAEIEKEMALFSK